MLYLKTMHGFMLVFYLVNFKFISRMYSVEYCIFGHI